MAGKKKETKKEAIGKKTGRKTKFEKEWIQIVEELGKKGLIDNQIAAFLGISVASLYNYQNEHEEFREALQRAKREADWKVKESVFKRAIGYNIEETEDLLDDSGEIINRKVKKKHVPGDMKAALMWLQNREPEEWREKKDVAVETDFIIDVSFSGETDEE